MLNELVVAFNHFLTVRVELERVVLRLVWLTAALCTRVLGCGIRVTKIAQHFLEFGLDVAHLSVCELANHLALNLKLLNYLINFVIVRNLFNLSLAIGPLQILKFKQVLHHLRQLLLRVTLQVFVANVEHVGCGTLFLDCCEVLLLVFNLFIDPPIPPSSELGVVREIDLWVIAHCVCLIRVVLKHLQGVAHEADHPLWFKWNGSSFLSWMVSFYHPYSAVSNSFAFLASALQNSWRVQGNTRTSRDTGHFFNQVSQG